jgi:hypothetical protein
MGAVFQLVEKRLVAEVYNNLPMSDVYSRLSAMDDPALGLGATKLDKAAKADAAAVAAGTSDDDYVTPEAMADVSSAATDARAALDGQSFGAPVSDGLIDGWPVLSRQLDADGRVLWAMTRGGPYVRGPNGLLNPLAEAVGGEARSRPVSAGLHEGSPILHMSVDRDGRADQVLTRDALHVRGPDGLRPLARIEEPAHYRVNATTGLAVNADADVCYILIIQGQSNAEGQMASGGVVADTPLYPGLVLMPDIGVRMPVRDGFPAAGQRFDDLADLVEAEDAVTGCYETAASSWANHLNEQVTADLGVPIRIAALVCAHGGQPLLKLKRGQPAYEWTLAGVRDLTRVIRARGWKPVVLAVNYNQTESDTSLATVPALYAAGLRALRRNLNDDLRAITGQSESVLLLIDAPQIPGQSALDHNLIAAQKLATAADPDILPAPPTYALPRVTGEEIHLDPVGQNRRGIGLARMTAEACFGAGWRALEPTGWWWDSSTILTVQFPHDVVLDEAGDVTATGFASGVVKGFRFDDNSGAPPAISSVVATGSLVQITLAAAPTGPRRRLAYATERNTGESRDGPVYGCRGLLRADDAGVTSLYDAHVNRLWCRPFILELGAS